MSLTSPKIERWSKAALLKWKAERLVEKSRGVLAPHEAVKTLAEYHVPGASFHPTELKLEPGLPEGDWQEIGRAVAHVRESAHLWLGDWLLYGTRLYGVQTAYDLARQATGLPEGTLRDARWCAKKYKPEERKPELSYCHHLVLAKYPTEVRERILTEAIEIGLTTRQCRKLAEDECGKREKPKTARVDVSIHLWPETVERLRQMADGRQLTWFVSRIVEDWLRSKGETTCLRAEVNTQERRDAWRKEGICYLCGSNPASEGRHTCENCRKVQRDLEKISANRPGTGRWKRRHHAIVAGSTRANA
jgi:hypothetical protein